MNLSSVALPPVDEKIAIIFVALEFWSGLWPGTESLCALSVAVDLDYCCVDHGVFHVRFVRTCLEKPDENIRLHPVAVSLEDCVAIAEGRRQVTPRTARAHDPQEASMKRRVTAAASGIGRLAEAMRPHLGPLSVRQYESFHPKLEHDQASDGSVVGKAL